MRRVDQSIGILRRPETGKAEFKEAMRDVGRHLGYSLYHDLATKTESITTPTGMSAKVESLQESPVLIPVLRAGIALFEGVQDIFPDSDVGFITAERNETTLQSKLSYVAIPDVEDKVVALIDPMLATGGSIIHCLQELVGARQIYVLSAISCNEGRVAVLNANPNVVLLSGVIDERLNEHGYILPGIGDAGDRAYGAKVFNMAV